MIKFLKNNARWIAGGFLLTFLSSFGQTFFIAGSIGEWKMMFNLSDGEMGRLYMFATLASAMTLPFVGKIVDIIDEHKVILICAPILAVAMLGAAFAPHVIVLVASIFLLRLMGQGMMTQISLTATGKWFAARRGRAMSVVVAGHQAGEFTLPAIFQIIVATAGFAMGWISGAVALLVVFMPLAVWAYSKPRVPRGEAPKQDVSGRQWTRAETLRDPIFYILLTGVLAPPFIGTTIFYHQDYMTQLNDWPPTAFARAISIMALTTVTFALVCGALVDRFTARRILPVFLIPLGSACLFASQASSVLDLFGFMMLIGVSYGFSSTLFGSLWPEVYGTKHLGAIRAVIVSAMVLATAVGPGLTGTLIDLGIPLPTQLLGLALWCLGAIILLTIASQILVKRTA